MKQYSNLLESSPLSLLCFFPSSVWTTPVKNPHSLCQLTIQRACSLPKQQLSSRFQGPSHKSNLRISPKFPELENWIELKQLIDLPGTDPERISSRQSTHSFDPLPHHCCDTVQWLHLLREQQRRFSESEPAPLFGNASVCPLALKRMLVSKRENVQSSSKLDQAWEIPLKDDVQSSSAASKDIGVSYTQIRIYIPTQ